MSNLAFAKTVMKASCDSARSRLNHIFGKPMPAIKFNIRNQWRHVLYPPNIVRRFGKQEDGATAVEFAVLAVPFFVLLFGIIETSLIFFAGQMLESAVDNVGRRIRTGQLDNTLTATEFKQEVCTESQILFSCSNIMIDLQVAAKFDDLGDPPLPDPDTNETDYSDYDFVAPCPSEIAMVTASYEWPIYTYFVSDNIYRNLPNSSGNPIYRKILLNAIAVFRTEPYPSGTGGRSC
jgi:Flp pilus assembly protein TadG